MTEVPFGPTGKIVYERTYSRTKADGTKETWPETVTRVVTGNLALVYGDSSNWSDEVRHEALRLSYYMNRFALLPAGRHLWATGIEGRQYLFNCHVAGWGTEVTEHFEFTFLRLMEGGGVGANYSTKHIEKFGAPRSEVECNIICDDRHPDYEELKPHLSEVDAGFPSPFIVHVPDSREGWAYALSHLIRTAFSSYHHDGSPVTRVYDVSGVRPSGSKLKTFGGTASGPAPFARMMHEVTAILNKAKANGRLTPLDAMEIDHAIAECVVSGGNRRSARMSIVRWDDPYVMDFINCKQDTGKHWTTNISVEIDDEFLNYLNMPEGGTDHNLYQAKAVHQMACNAVLENGEPGYWNSSLSQTGETGQIIATNPCGEIALEEWENCNLGHVNLDYFVKDFNPNYEELIEAHELMTRFLIRATFGDVNDDKQKAQLLKNRRIGVGHLGVQGYFAKQGVKYSDIPDSAPVELSMLYSKVREAARVYAFELRIPEPVKVTAVAPTGSVAKLPGVTEGIHPIYSRYFERRVRFSLRDEAQMNTVLEAQTAGFHTEEDSYDPSGMTHIVVYPTEDILVQQVKDLGLPEEIVQSADELSLEDMLRVQKCWQEHWADNAVSYTANIAEGQYTPEEVADTLAKYLPYLKGTTIMVDATRPQAPYKRITKEQYLGAEATRIEDGTDLECSSGACPVR